MKSQLALNKFPVLVIGFGKIGVIKSEIWKSLGAEVYVYDVSPSAHKRIIASGYAPYESLGDTHFKDLIVDISTPAAMHAIALGWVLDTLIVRPRIILIEKPLVSSSTELTLLLDVLKSHPDVEQHSIFINESYYASTALKKLKELISESGETIKAIRIDLSKNRIMDNDKGRFFDYELGAIGIEMPHMIAIAQYFGLDLSVLAKQNAKLYVDSRREDNQGVAINYHDDGVTVDLLSFLGDFRIDEAGNIAGNQDVTRALTVHTETKVYEVVFDPTPGIPRYHAKITETNTLTQEKEDYLLADNHLREHLAKFTQPHDIATMNYVSIQNSIRICELLFTLRKNAVIEEAAPEILEPVLV